MGTHTHAKYTDAEALAAAIAGGLSKVIWKDASERALSDLDRTTTLDYTDLDLTAYTSANAKFAIVQLAVHIDSYTDGRVRSIIRKNGTTPTHVLQLFGVNNNPISGDVTVTSFIVGLDSGQVIEYKLQITGTAQADFFIDVLGYIE